MQFISGVRAEVLWPDQWILQYGYQVDGASAEVLAPLQDVAAVFADDEASEVGEPEELVEAEGGKVGS